MVFRRGSLALAALAASACDWSDWETVLPVCGYADDKLRFYVEDELGGGAAGWSFRVLTVGGAGTHPDDWRRLRFDRTVTEGRLRIAEDEATLEIWMSGAEDSQLEDNLPILPFEGGYLSFRMVEQTTIDRTAHYYWREGAGVTECGIADFPG